MNQIWVSINGDYYCYYDSEETARLSYKYWCETHNSKFNEEIFRDCFRPLAEMEQIETMETVKNQYERRK